MGQMKAMLPFLAAIALVFYSLPLLMTDTGTAIVLFLVLVPAICFGCSVMYGMKHSFHILYAAFVAILFIPSIFLFYNSTAWIYVAIYGMIALIGNVVGMIWFKRTK